MAVIFLGVIVLELGAIAVLMWRRGPGGGRPAAPAAGEIERVRKLEEAWNRGVESLLGYDLGTARRAHRDGEERE